MNEYVYVIRIGYDHVLYAVVSTAEKAETSLKNIGGKHVHDFGNNSLEAYDNEGNFVADAIKCKVK